MIHFCSPVIPSSAYTLQSPVPTYTVSSEPIAGEEFEAVEPSDEVRTQMNSYMPDLNTYRNLDAAAQAKVSDDVLQKGIANDSLIQSLSKQYYEAATPELIKYKKQLEKDYPDGTLKSAEQINKLLLEKQNELTIGKLIEDPKFIKRTNLLGMAVGLNAQQLDSRFAREDSTFLMGLDAIRGIGDSYGVGDMFADSVEGFASATHGIGVSIGDKAWGSYAGNRYRNQSKKANQLEEQIANGDFTADDKVRWDVSEGKYMVSDKGRIASNRLNSLNTSANEWQEEVVEQIEDIAESEEYLSAFKQANYDDGIGFSDLFLTVGQALPHIGMAAGGTALGLATGGTALAALAPIATL